MNQLSPSFVRKYLYTYGIEVDKDHKGEIMSKLTDHLDAVIYNITGIAMAIALVNQSFVINGEHLQSVRKYIEASCQKAKSKQSKQSQKGGTSMPSDYFGYRHPNFSEWNWINQQNVSDVRFDEGIARTEMGGGSSHAISFMAHEKHAKSVIKGFLKQHQVKINATALTELLAIIDVHIQCLANDLKAVPKLGIKQIEKVMKLKRHAVFH